MTTPAPQVSDYDAGRATTSAAGSDSVSLSRYVAMLRRRWIVIAAFTVAGVLVGIVASILTPPTYEAEATVALSPSATSGSGNSGRTDINTVTETVLANKNFVLEYARDQMQAKYPEYENLGRRLLRDRLTVTAPTGSQVLEFKFRATGRGGEAAQEAADGANAFAQGYLKLRGDQRAETVKINAEGLRAQRTRLKDEVTALNTAISAPGASAAQRSSLTQERDALLQSIAQLRIQEDAVIGSGSASAGVLAQSALAPGAPVAPRDLLYAAVGGLLGLLLGLAYALRRELRDDHLRTPNDLARAGAGQTLASVRVPRRVPAGAGLAVLSAPDGPEAEGYRLLAAKLQAPSLPVGRSVLLTGPGGGDSRVAANVAVALAQMGHRVLLWAAPQALTTSFSGLGLTEVALPAAGVTGTVVSLDSLPGLWLAPLRDQDLAGASATTAAAPTEFVLVDDSTGHSQWRTLALASEVDSVLLVAHVGRSGRRELGQLLTQLSSIGAPILGSALLMGSKIAPPPTSRSSAPAAATQRPAPQGPAATSAPQGSATQGSTQGSATQAPASTPAPQGSAPSSEPARATTPPTTVLTQGSQTAAASSPTPQAAQPVPVPAVQVPRDDAPPAGSTGTAAAGGPQPTPAVSPPYTGQAPNPTQAPASSGSEGAQAEAEESTNRG